VARLLVLAENPRPPNADLLTGHVNVWRVRVGDYRILYTIEDAVLLVLLLRIGHRREVYRLAIPAFGLSSEEDQDGEAKT
jgi:mRNA interferase RelE/StbE